MKIVDERIITIYFKVISSVVSYNMSSNIYSASSFEIFQVYCSFLSQGTRILKRVIFKNKVTKTKTSVQDFEENRYRKLLISKNWEKATTLQQYLSTFVQKNQAITCVINGKWVRVTEDILQKEILKKYYDILTNFISSNDIITEVGCGPGSKLFSLKTQGLQNKMEGYDFSEDAINAGRKINNFFDCDIKFDLLDLTEEFPKNIFKDKTIFSSRVFELLKYDTEKAISNLIEAHPRQVFHFEPVVELLGWSIRDMVSKLYIYALDYQNNLLSSLRKFEEKGLIEITDIRRTGLQWFPYSETSFIRWIPKSH